MLFRPGVLGCILGVLCLSLSGVSTQAQSGTKCSTALGTPVLVYDSIARRAYMVYRNQMNPLPPSLSDRGGYGTIPPDAIVHGTEPTFLCDGKPVEIYIVNRRLKQVFTVTTNSVFQLSNGLPDLRGFPNAPSVAQPTATQAPTAAPQSKGALSTSGQATVDQFIDYFLADETFDKSMQKLQDDGATVVELYHFIQLSLNQYNSTLDGMIGGGPLVPVQGSVTALVTTALFNAESTEIANQFPLPSVAPPVVAPAPPPAADQLEASFDRLAGRIDRTVADVQRLNAKIQSYPVIDNLVNLGSQVNAFEDSLRILDHEYQSLLVAVQITQDLLDSPDGRNYLQERNGAEIRILLRQRYGSSGANLDDSTIERIVDLYTAPNGHYDPFIYGAPGVARALTRRLIMLGQIRGQWLRQVRRELGLPVLSSPPSDGFPEWATGTPLRTVDLHNSAQKLADLKLDISAVNIAEANTFALINRVYDDYRAPTLPLTVDLQGNSGNLIVFYSVTGTERFLRYQVTNEVQQPQSGCILSLSATASAINGTPTCSPSAAAATPVGAAAQSASPAATSPAAAGNTGSAPPADFYGRFEVHHFTHGALVTGVAFDSVVNRTYSWFACPQPPNGGMATTGGNVGRGNCYSSSTKSAPTSYEFIKSNSVGVAAVVGVDLFLKSHDMFPGVRDPWYSRYLPTDPFLGAAVYPLNQYFYGGAAEPLRGFNVSLGGVFGSQTTLPATWAYQPGDIVTASATPTVPSATRYRNGLFFMLGFDTSLFKAAFGSVWSNITTIGSPAAATTTAAPAGSK